MSGQVAGPSDQHVPASPAVTQQAELSERCFDRLDRMEISILTEQYVPQRSQHAVHGAATREIPLHECARFVHLLLSIEQSRQLVQQRLWVLDGSTIGF